MSFDRCGRLMAGGACRAGAQADHRGGEQNSGKRLHLILLSVFEVIFLNCRHYPRFRYSVRTSNGTISGSFRTGSRL
ncbi:hypothetical protein BQ8482_140051 [Mesorhizobium delmotii]|uniref:Uncharacterized protein n=1 Tax=Mesorhizobium delmotii TaxID=1631247 RepID=A0A2P9AH08_9HYPH|nr:hypothetical protein BQ8482_140051 [Mesorhizobium delmotii]